MTHNMTVTVEDSLWEDMQRHPEIRWSVIMKEAAKERLRALTVLEKLQSRTKLTEKEINEFSIKLGKKITNRR